VFLIGTGGLTLLSIVAFSLLNTRSLPLIIVGVLVLGFFLSTYEATMPGSLPTMFYTHIRYRTLSVTFNLSVSLFGGTTPLIACLVSKLHKQYFSTCILFNCDKRHWFCCHFITAFQYGWKIIERFLS